MRIVTILLI